MKKINVLQSFRAIFIVLICIEHMALNNRLSLLGAGGEGVAFFIVLSGFLVGYLYRERSIDASFKNSKIFVCKKIKKFYPLHIIAIVLSALLQILYLLKNHFLSVKVFGQIVAKILLNILFLQVYVPIDGWYMNEINGVSWFLSTIVFCYVFSLTGIAIVKKAREKQKSVILFILLLLIYILVSILFRASDLKTFVLYVFPPVRFLEYFMAMIIGYNYNEKFHTSKSAGAATVIEITTILLFITGHIFLKTGMYGNKGDFQYVMMFIISMVIVYVFSKERGMVSRLLDNSLLVGIGNASFYIYIMHQVIIKYVTTIFGWNNIGAAVSFVVIAIYTIVVSKYYDKVVEGIKKRVYSKY